MKPSRKSTTTSNSSGGKRERTLKIHQELRVLPLSRIDLIVAETGPRTGTNLQEAALKVKFKNNCTSKRIYRYPLRIPSGVFPKLQTDVYNYCWIYLPPGRWCGVYRRSLYPVDGSWCVGDELGWEKVALLAAYNLEIRFWSMGCHSGRVVDGF